MKAQRRHAQRRAVWSTVLEEDVNRSHVDNDMGSKASYDPSKLRNTFLLSKVNNELRESHDGESDTDLLAQWMTDRPRSLQPYAVDKGHHHNPAFEAGLRDMISALTLENDRLRDELDELQATNSTQQKQIDRLRVNDRQSIQEVLTDSKCLIDHKMSEMEAKMDCQREKEAQLATDNACLGTTLARTQRDFQDVDDLKSRFLGDKIPAGVTTRLFNNPEFITRLDDSNETRLTEVEKTTKRWHSPIPFRTSLLLTSQEIRGEIPKHSLTNQERHHFHPAAPRTMHSSSQEERQKAIPRKRKSGHYTDKAMRTQIQPRPQSMRQQHKKNTEPMVIPRLQGVHEPGDDGEDVSQEESGLLYLPKSPTISNYNDRLEALVATYHAERKDSLKAIMVAGVANGGDNLEMDISP